MDARLPALLPLPNGWNIDEEIRKLNYVATIAANHRKWTGERQAREAKAKRRLEQDAARQGGVDDGGQDADAAAAAALAPEDAAAEGQGQGAGDAPEPERWDASCLAPLPQVPALDLQDLAALDLPDGLTAADQQATFTHLLASRQLLALQPPTPGLLRLLFGAVVRSDAPQHAAETLAAYYATEGAGAPWAPSLSDFHASFKDLGYTEQQQGAAAGGGRDGSGAAQRSKRTTGAPVAAATAMQEDQAEAGPSSGGDAGPASASGQCERLRCLLLLLAQLCELGAQGQGQLPAFEFGRDAQVAGKALLVALARLSLHPTVHRLLLPEVQAALAALADAPWGDAMWGRVEDDVARQLAALGPTHRAASAALAAMAPLCSDRVRRLQQAAALGLLAATAQGSRGCGAGSSSSRASAARPSPSDLLEHLSLRGDARAVEARLKELVDPPKGTGASSSKGGGGGGGVVPDYWRLLTALESAHRVLWAGAYKGFPEDSDPGAAAAREVVPHFRSYLRAVAKWLQRRRTHVAVRVWAFVTELDSYYTECVTTD